MITTFFLQDVQHTKQFLKLTWYTNAFPTQTINLFSLGGRALFPQCHPGLRWKPDYPSSQGDGGCRQPSLQESSKETPHTHLSSMRGW